MFSTQTTRLLTRNLLSNQAQNVPSQPLFTNSSQCFWPTLKPKIMIGIVEVSIVVLCVLYHHWPFAVLYQWYLCNKLKYNFPVKEMPLYDCPRSETLILQIIFPQCKHRERPWLLEAMLWPKDCCAVRITPIQFQLAASPALMFKLLNLS